MKIDALTFCQCDPESLRRPWAGERTAANDGFILVSMEDPIPLQELTPPSDVLRLIARCSPRSGHATVKQRFAPRVKRSVRELSEGDLHIAGQRTAQTVQCRESGNPNKIDLPKFCTLSIRHEFPAEITDDE